MIIKIILIWFLLGSICGFAFGKISDRLKTPEEKAYEDYEQTEYLKNLNKNN